jgi:Ca2+-binding RTX toxin-like protein
LGNSNIIFSNTFTKFKPIVTIGIRNLKLSITKIKDITILASLKTLTEGNDTLTANKDGTNNIQALAGDDTITGGIDARNNIDGGADDDTLKQSKCSQLLRLKWYLLG